MQQNVRNVSLPTGFNPTIRAGDIDNIDALNARVKVCFNRSPATLHSRQCSHPDEASLREFVLCKTSLFWRLGFTCFGYRGMRR